MTRPDRHCKISIVIPYFLAYFASLSARNCITLLISGLLASLQAETKSLHLHDIDTRTSSKMLRLQHLLLSRHSSM